MSEYALTSNTSQIIPPYRRFRAYYAVLGALLLIFSILLPHNIISSYANISDNSLDKKEDIAFSISKFSPYLTDDTAGSFAISAKTIEFTQVKLSVLKATNTRSELFNFADKPSNKNPISTITLPFSSFFEITSNGEKNYEVTFLINSLDDTVTNSIAIPKTGIYPVAIELINSSNKTIATKYSFTNYFSGISFSTQAYSEKLNVVPVITTSQTYEEEKLFSSDSKLTDVGKKQQKELLKLSEDLNKILPLDTQKSFLINGQLIDNFSLINSDENSPLIPSNASQYSQYIANTYTPMNITELDDIGEKAIFTQALTKSRSSLLTSEINAPSRTLVTKSISNSTLEDIVNAGIDQLIVDEKTFTSKTSTDLKPVKISINESTVALATYTTDFYDHMDQSTGIDLQANFLNAYSTVVALEAPSNNRALIIPLNISTLNSDAIYNFLASLNNNPISKSLTIDSMFASIAPDKQISSKIEKTDFGFLPKDTFDKNAFSEVKKYKDSLISLFQESSIDGKLALSIYYGSISDEATKSITEQEALKLKAIADNTKNYISLPTKRTITLTSNESTIPVTIKNTSTKTINVQIKLKSDKLIFPKSDTFKVTLTDLNTTLNVPIKTRTTGSFPIEITMTSINGDIALASQSVTIRSTSFSGVGLTILIGSFTFLLIWWIINAKKNRKKIPGDVLDLHKEKLA